MFRLKQTIAALLVVSCSFAIAQQTTSNANSNKKEKEPADILEQRAEYFARQHGAKPNKISVVPRLKALKQLENMRQKEKLLLQSSPQLQSGAPLPAAHSAVWPSAPRSGLPLAPRLCSTPPTFSPDA